MSRSPLLTTYPPLEVPALRRGLFVHVARPRLLASFVEEGAVDPGLLFGDADSWSGEAWSEAGFLAAASGKGLTQRSSSVGGRSEEREKRGTSFLYRLGRGAVYAAARSLAADCDCGGPHSVAVPSYHCGSEIEALVRAGFEPRFYRVRRDLNVDPESFAEAISGACLVYVISFFGFPPAIEGMWPPEVGCKGEALSRPGASTRAFDSPRRAQCGARSHGPIVEDAAQALFSRYPDGMPVGSKGDAAVFSIRKSLGTPDGGALWLRIGSGGTGVVPRSIRQSRVVRARSLISQALLLVAARDGLSGAVGARAVSVFSKSERAAVLGELSEAIHGPVEDGGAWELSASALDSATERAALVSYLVLAGQWPSAVVASRRANYTRLLWEFDLGDFVPEGFRYLPEGTAPLFLPVECPDRKTAVSLFFKRGVRVIEVWRVPHRLTPEHLEKETRAMRERLLGLPVHQVLSGSALQRVGEVAAEVLHQTAKSSI